MKILYIIRHAKSSWEDANLRDFDRPLNEKGKIDAKKLGKKLKEKSIFPDMVFSSPAKRAKSTAKKICKEIIYNIDKIRYEEGIYNNHMKEIGYYIDFIKNIENKYNKVFIIGHNSAFEKLASFLSKNDIGHLKTAGIVKITFDVEAWSEILN